ncbi:PLDc N-terminal domain-containing protein [Sphingomonas daechungensis]|uniref:PLDc N-terminal domain-containing protein n=1 Tax=Sphingomonas daechungensis TaxID=1176646 RepID=UPI00378411AF
MILYVGIIALQVYCIVDVIRRNGRTFWIFPLLIAPVVSAIAYFIVEILPTLRHNKHVRSAKQQIVQKMDPERELRAAQTQLEIANTMANHLRLADALTDLGRHPEALKHYQRGAGAIPDFRTGEKLARCLFLNDKPREALAVIEKLPAVTGQSDRDRAALLRARVLEDLSQSDEALALYADVCERMPGDEARCRYAALLLRAGRKGDARKVLEDVEHRMKFIDRHTRASEAPMYDWAMTELSGLRT